MTHMYQWLGITIAAMFGIATASGAQEAAQTFPAAGVHTVRVEQKEGLVQVTGLTNIDTVRVTVENRKGGSKCPTDIQPNAGGVFVVKAKHGLLKGLRCDVDVAIEMPAQLALDAKVGASTIALAGLRGNVRVHAGTGRIEGTVATNHAELTIGTGKAQLTWLEPPDRGRLQLKVGTGRMELEFPKATVAQVRPKPQIGRLQTEIRTDPTSPFLIDGTLGVGTLVLRYTE